MRWIKGEYDRLYDQVKSGIRTPCCEYDNGKPVKGRFIQMCELGNVEWLDQTADDKDKEIERRTKILEMVFKIMAGHEGDKTENAKEFAWQQFKKEHNL